MLSTPPATEESSGYTGRAAYLVPASAITHGSGGRRSPPERHPATGHVPEVHHRITVRRQPAPATTGDRTYLRTPVLRALARGTCGRLRGHGAAHPQPDRAGGDHDDRQH